MLLSRVWPISRNTFLRLPRKTICILWMNLKEKRCGFSQHRWRKETEALKTWCCQKSVFLLSPKCHLSLSFLCTPWIYWHIGLQYVRYFWKYFALVMTPEVLLFLKESNVSKKVICSPIHVPVQKVTSLLRPSPAGHYLVQNGSTLDPNRKLCLNPLVALCVHSSNRKTVTTSFWCFKDQLQSDTTMDCDMFRKGLKSQDIALLDLTNIFRVFSTNSAAKPSVRPGLFCFCSRHHTVWTSSCSYRIKASNSECHLKHVEILTWNPNKVVLHPERTKNIKSIVSGDKWTPLSLPISSPRYRRPSLSLSCVLRHSCRELAEQWD